MHFAKHLLLWSALSVAALTLLAACAPTATLNALASRGNHALTEGVAYAALAGMPLITGIYASLLPALVAALFSGSMRL